MNILNIGFPELIFIFVLALIVLGPRNLLKTSKQLSDAIRKFVTSDTWKSIVNSTKEIRDIQGKIIEDTGLQDSLNTLRNSTRDLVNPSLSTWTPGTNISTQSIEKNIPNPPIENNVVSPDKDPQAISNPDQKSDN